MALVVSPTATTTANPTATLDSALTHFESVLTEDQRHVFLTHVHNAQQQIPDASTVMQFVAELDAANHGSMRTSVAPRLCTFLDATQQFVGIVDTFVSANPTLAALIWGGVKTVILAASNVAQYFDKVTAIIMKVGKTCPIYRQFAALFSDSVPLQAALSEHYAIVLRLATKIIEVMQRNPITQLISSVVNPFSSEFRTFQEQLTDSAKFIELQVSLAANRAARRLTDLTVSESKKEEEHRGLFRKFRSDIRAEQSEKQLKRILREVARAKSSIRQQLSTLDHRKSWSEIQKRRHKDTALWFKDEQAFQDWRAESTTMVLWCPGKMGVGKTVLVSNIVAFLYQNSEPNQIVSHHFCRAEHNLTTIARNILGSIALQLLDLYINEVEGDSLRQLEKTCSNLGPNDIVDLLLSRLQSGRKHYIIIDGLDECAQNELATLTRCVRKLCKKDTLQFSVLLSGRPELQQTLTNTIDLEYRMEISPTTTRNDVEKYIEDTLYDYLEERRFPLSSPEIILSIVNLLIQDYSDMFLFAHLFIEDLCDLTRETDVMAALQNPPLSVGDLVRQKLNRIRSRDTSEVAIQILQYCGVTKRPLTIGEFGELLSVKILQPSFDRTSIPYDMYRMVSMCCGLAFVEEEDETIHYVHHSVRNYLFTADNSLPAEFQVDEIDTHLGKICLTYLNFSDFDRKLSRRTANSTATIAPVDIGVSSIRNSNPLVSKAAQKLLRSRRQFQQLSPEQLKRKTEDVLGESMSKQLGDLRLQSQFLLLSYVQQFWIYHTARLDPDDNSAVWSLFLHFVKNTNIPILRPWISGSKINHDASVAWALRYKDEAILLVLASLHLAELSTDSIASLISYAVHTRQHSLMRLLAEYGKHNAWVLLEGLVTAAELGALDCLEIFLRERVPSSTSRDKRSALVVAAGSGYSSIVERLLVAGVSVDARDGDGWTALYLGALTGHIDVVEQLLSAGADVNATTNQGLTALYEATQKGYIDTVDQLLLAGADINTTDPTLGYTALITAADHGYVDVVERLLSAGADVNATTVLTRWTALHMAAENGHVDVVERLLSAGADVNAASKYGETALHKAAEKGYVDVVKRLLSAGAQVDTTNEARRTALDMAAASGHAEVVESLLSAGANIKSTTRQGQTALYTAAENGHTEVVARLLSAGADVDAATPEGFTAFHVATAVGHMDVVGELLSAGANINLSAGRGSAALFLASKEGYFKVVEQLLSAGVDVNVTDRQGQSALYIAAEKGHDGIVERLLSAGANINALNNRETALHVAAKKGHTDVVEQLLSAGAHVDIATASFGWTPLIEAVTEGHAAVVGELLAAGANVHARTFSRKTALDYATENGGSVIAEMLKRAVALSLDEAVAV